MLALKHDLITFLELIANSPVDILSIDNATVVCGIQKSTDDFVVTTV